MTDNMEEPERPGVQDIPRLVKTLIERAIDLGSARIQLAQLELKEEVRVRIRRAVFASIFISLLMLGFALLNVAVLSWLASSIGLTGAAFIIAGVYFLAGIVGLVWFRATGGFNPPDRDEDQDEKES